MTTAHTIDRPLYLIDKLNLANCAIQRSRQVICEKDRWNREYRTMQIWMRHNCMAFGHYHYIDA